LTFGWWRQDEDAGGGFAAFEPIYGGRIPFMYEDGNDSGPLEKLVGTAKYEGGAAGNYTDYSGRGAPDTNPEQIGDDTDLNRPDRHGGWFVAAAALTADFDDNTISGMISNFRGTHGPLGDWEVELGDATLTYGTEDPNTEKAQVLITRTTTSGNADAQAWSGEWHGQLYGESAEDHSRLPSGVAGWFRAGTSADEKGLTGVAVQGAFAATRQP